MERYRCKGLWVQGPTCITQLTAAWSLSWLSAAAGRNCNGKITDVKATAISYVPIKKVDYREIDYRENPPELHTIQIIPYVSIHVDITIPSMSH